jgi:hypoxia up-regulated 1
VLNSLEAFTYRARDHLEDDSFIAVSTAEVRSKLEEMLSATSDWIYSDGHDAAQDVLKNKLKELEDVVKPILKRKTEAVERPAAIKTLEQNLSDLKNVAGIVKKQLDDQVTASSLSSEAASKASASSAASPSSSSDFLDDLEEDELLKASSSEAAAEPETTPVATIYTDEDLKTIEEAHDEAKKWLEEKQAAQSKLTETDDPALTTSDIKAQTSKLEQAIIRMMTKKANALNMPKQQKPKPKASKPKKKAAKKDKKAAKKGEEPTQEELDEAMEKAGLKGEGVKLKSFGVGKDKEVRDKDGNLLTKLDFGEDASEEDILAAIDRATKEGKERLEKENQGEQPRDEL